jgi:tetratricopeptide (TPR) repeat protein
VPADVDPALLDASVRAELRSLGRVADQVAGHLVAAGQLLDSDPELALRHARAARSRAARIGVVREAVGIAAYHAAEWSEALAELRAARRMTGSPQQLPVMADCERALGRPEQALRLVESARETDLGPAERVELRIVEAGARRDLGELSAALLALQSVGLDRSREAPWSARLWYAYADVLLAAGRVAEAVEWFLAAAAADEEGQTDAEERLSDIAALGSSGDREPPAAGPVPDGPVPDGPVPESA